VAVVAGLQLRQMTNNTKQAKAPTRHQTHQSLPSGAGVTVGIGDGAGTTGSANGCATATVLIS